MLFRFAGAVAVPDAVAAAFGFGFGAATTGEGVDGSGVGGSSSTASTGSPIVIVLGGVATFEVVVVGTAGEATVALGAGRFGSSVDTAITAAAVRSVMTPPTAAIPMRAASVVFFAAGGIAGRLRIGARPALMSFAV